VNIRNVVTSVSHSCAVSVSLIKPAQLQVHCNIVILTYLLAYLCVILFCMASIYLEVYTDGFKGYFNPEKYTM